MKRNNQTEQIYAQIEANQKILLSYRPLPKETLKSLQDYYRIGLTYSSNAIEGNSLTESETKVIIEDGLTVEGKPLREIYETVGHANAYNHLNQLATNKNIEENDIKTLHKLFYEKIDSEKAGKYRNVKVFISGSKYSVAKVDDIEPKMKKLVNWFNNNEKKIHPIELAANMHKKFIFIHPFIDGNGRLARLLMNLALIRNGYNIAIIPPILRHEYIYTLEKAHTDDTDFHNFIAQCVLNTQNDLIRLFRN